MAGDFIDPGLGGAMRTMWRSVYRKAVEATEPRIRALLQEHVYSYHLGLGGAAPPPGGGVVELGRAVATAGQVTLRVPASGALPTGYSGLWVVGSGRYNSTTASGQVYLFFNDDTTVGPYNYGSVSGTPTSGDVFAAGSGIDSAVSLGVAPPASATELQTVFGVSGTLPLHEGAGFPKTGQFLSAYLQTAANGPQPRTTLLVYTPATPGPITSVHLRCLSLGWRVGSTLLVYGAPNPA